LDAAASALAHAMSDAKLQRALLLVSCRVDQTLAATIDSKAGVDILDRDTLLDWASKVPEVADQLISILESNDARTHPCQINRVLGRGP